MLTKKKKKESNFGIYYTFRLSKKRYDIHVLYGNVCIYLCIQLCLDMDESLIFLSLLIDFVRFVENGYNISPRALQLPRLLSFPHSFRYWFKVDNMNIIFTSYNYRFFLSIYIFNPIMKFMSTL